MVRSNGAALSSRARSAACRAASRSAKADSMASRAALTASPIVLRSSAGTPALPRKRPVSSPFFPKSSAFRARRRVSSVSSASWAWKRVRRRSRSRRMSDPSSGAIGRVHRLREAGPIGGVPDSLRGSSLRSELGELLEGRRVVLCDRGQHLAVELDARLLQVAHEARVAGAVVAAGSVDAGNPKATKVALAQLAADVGVNPALVEAVDCLAEARPAPTDETLV